MGAYENGWVIVGGRKEKRKERRVEGRKNGGGGKSGWEDGYRYDEIKELKTKM